MLWPLIRLAISFALPTLAGWTIVSACWREGPRILKAILGIGLGLGAAGTLWMLGLLLSGSKFVAIATSDATLVAVTALMWLYRIRAKALPSNRLSERFTKLQILAAAGIVLTLISAAASLSMFAYISHHGDFDAQAIWNVKARFFYFGRNPLELLPDLTSPDYPLLLPGLVTRGWQYSSRDTVVMPMSLALFFTAGSIVLVCGLRLVTSKNIALFAGCVLAGTPFFLIHGLSQYADIVVCFFTTSAVALFAFADFDAGPRTRYLPFLSGLFAGFVACTKNEGTLVVVSMIAARAVLFLWERRWKEMAIRMGLFLAGAAPGLLTLTVFRKVAPVPSVLFGNMTSATIQTRIVDSARHLSILEGYRRDLWGFGNWWINPLLLLLLYVVLRRMKTGTSSLTQAWRAPALFLIIMLSGYYFVYLFSPYEVVWHVQSSFSRLLLQLWPSALLMWSLLTTETANAS